MYEASSVWNGNKEQNNFHNDENMQLNMYSWKWQNIVILVHPKTSFGLLAPPMMFCRNILILAKCWLTSDGTRLCDGALDPWYGGSITQAGLNLNKANARGVYVFDLVGSAHHLELRNPNTCDPPNVVNARDQVFRVIGQRKFEFR
uniref:Uncharacterized protein n=1 Tax=Acrobeloides nanus TaxID=290746 RepID=A0A914CVA7_9BILA